MHGVASQMCGQVVRPSLGGGAGGSLASKAYCPSLETPPTANRGVVLGELRIREYLKSPTASLQRLSGAIDEEVQACQGDNRFWIKMQKLVRSQSEEQSRHRLNGQKAGAQGRSSSWMLPDHEYPIPQREPLIRIVRNRRIHRRVADCYASRRRNPHQYADPSGPTFRPERGGCGGCRASWDWLAGAAARPLGSTPPS